MSTQSPTTDATFRAAQRRLAEALGSGAAAEGDRSLEAARALTAEAPRLVSAPVVEGHGMRSRRVDVEPVVEAGSGFAAFLDGTQASRPLAYDAGMPIVHGTVAAVVRERRNRRMVTWPRGPRVERSLYAPLAYLSATARDALLLAPWRVVDTTEPDAQGERPPAHPLALLERAVHFVQADRERVERELAEQWCRGDHGNLFVDGGLQGSEIVAAASCVVGVVKSHRTLYVDGDALRLVLGLRAGERSSVFRIAAPRRAAVASWYLRLRDPAGRDPMWGLVRVEAALRGADESPESLGARADAVSRRILAETTPLALPDARWDKMVYGIRDCEQFLAAIA